MKCTLTSLFLMAVFLFHIADKPPRDYFASKFYAVCFVFAMIGFFVSVICMIWGLVP